MKKNILSPIALALLLSACQPSADNEKQTMAGKGDAQKSLVQSSGDIQPNPLLVDYDTPFGVPDFAKINNDDYLPAFTLGITQNEQEITAIA
ncbi:MAG: hypothetical protein ACI9C4_001951, partial [Paraglaciecola sp.]